MIGMVVGYAVKKAIPLTKSFPTALPIERKDTDEATVPSRILQVKAALRHQ